MHDPVESAGVDRGDESERSTKRTARRVLFGRAFWITADQAMSSVSNFALSIAAARAVSPEQYGAFAVGFSLYGFVAGLAQAVAGQVVVIRYSGATPDEYRRVSSRAAGASLLVGACAAAVLLAALPLISGETRQSVAVIAVLLPGLVLQDLWRTVFVSGGNPKLAFVNDGIWTVLQFVVIGLLLVAEVSSVVPYMLAWGVAAAVAAAAGSWQGRSLPHLAGAKNWFESHRDISVPTLANSIATVGCTQAALIGIAAVSSQVATGAVRAAQTLLGPLNVVGFAALSFAVPEIVRHRLAGRALIKAALVVSAFLVLVDLLWGGALLLLPDSAGRALLGETWPGAREALPGMVVFTSAIGATAGANGAMRAIARTDLMLLSSLILGPAIVILALVGVLLGGAAGAAWGFATAGIVAILPTWILLVRAVNGPGARFGRLSALSTRRQQ